MKSQDLKNIVKQARKFKDLAQAIRKVTAEKKSSTLTTWLVLQRQADGAYHIQGTQDHCPGGAHFSKDIGAIMVQQGDQQVRCHSEGWVTNDRQYAFIRFRDWHRRGEDCASVSATDSASVEVSNAKEEKDQ